MKWTWNPRTREYRNEDGRTIGEGDMPAIRDEFVTKSEGLGKDYAARIADGSMSVGTFEREMRATLKSMHMAQYTLGRGGRSQMGPADYGRVGRLLRDQYGHLNDFARDIADGTQTEGQIGQRAQNFMGSSRQSYERGKAFNRGIDLPAYPGDGGTECHGNCKCSWDIQETPDEWHAHWTLGGGEHCNGCLGRQALYSPFVMGKPQ